MGNVALIRKSLTLLAALVALSAFNEVPRTSATNATVSGVPSTTYAVTGSFSNSGVTLTEAPNATQTNIKINDRYLLMEGWTIKVGDEYMIIDALLGGPIPPYSMDVQRGANGSTPASHANGTPVQTGSMTIDIYANNVTMYEGYGLGAFQLYVTLPPELEYVQLMYDSTWLDNTGRPVWCNGPHQVGPMWAVDCSTTGATPNGVTGSGRIATLIVMPSETPGPYAIDLGGDLYNVAAKKMPSTFQNPTVAVLECPDVNLDGRISGADILSVAKSQYDSGEDTGVTLASQIDAVQTSVSVGDSASLLAGDTISVEDEIMGLLNIQQGTPDLLAVNRAINVSFAKPHDAGRHIYRVTSGGNDGVLAYTPARDVNHTGTITGADILIVAHALYSECVAP